MSQRNCYRTVVLLGMLASFIGLHADETEVDREPARGSKYAATAAMEGIVSPHTETLIGILKNWPKGRKFCPDKNDDSITVQAIRTPGKEYYIGTRKCMIVRAPIEKLQKVLEDISVHPQLFPGLRWSREIARDANRYVITSERDTPLLVPNCKMEQGYVYNSPAKGKKIYRFQLKQSNIVKFSDGINVLESLGPDLTRFTTYDFYEADVGGLLMGIAGSRIWTDSIKGSFRSDYAIKTRAEHEDWSLEVISKTADALADRAPVDDVPYFDKFPAE